MKKRTDLPILIVDDDQDDCELAEKAFRRSNVENPVKFLPTGEDLLLYLRRQGGYSDPKTSPWPCLVLLDLNMPKLDGRKTLKILKSDSELRNLPVIIMTTSRAVEDIQGTYDLGANSFITKAMDFDGLIAIAESLKKYWLEVVELPAQADGDAE